LEDVIDLADRRGVELATVSGEIDLATPTGRMVARMTVRRFSGGPFLLVGWVLSRVVARL